MFIFRKIWRTLFSCYIRFKIRVFAILPMIHVLKYKVMQTKFFNVYEKSVSHCIQIVVYLFYLLRLN